MQEENREGISGALKTLAAVVIVLATAGAVSSAVPHTGQNLASSGACSPQPGHARTA